MDNFRTQNHKKQNFNSKKRKKLSPFPCVNENKQFKSMKHLRLRLNGVNSIGFMGWHYCLLEVTSWLCLSTMSFARLLALPCPRTVKITVWTRIKLMFLESTKYSLQAKVKTTFLGTSKLRHLKLLWMLERQHLASTKFTIDQINLSLE